MVFIRYNWDFMERMIKKVRIGEIMIKENWIEVKTYKVTAYCDKCKRGNMIPTGILKTTHPPLHEHKCTWCGCTRDFREPYPIIRYEEIPYE